MALEEKKCFKTKKFTYVPGQRMYLSSDGYYSQFGGSKGKKFMRSQFINKLDELQTYPIDKQKELLMRVFIEWKSGTEQVDDVLVIGIEL